MTASSELNLFKPIKVGDFELKQRIALAPLSRFRAIEHLPRDLHVEYYTQRATAPGTLLITEATFISEKAAGYPNAPGVFSKEQIEAWKKVYAGVHKNGSKIVHQLWALGRSAIKADLDMRGLDFVSASNVPDNSKHSTNPPNTIPRPLTKDEIKEYVADYVQAAKNALGAGADGVEIHSANGYLLDQFLHENTNNRTDEYGGSIENRCRFTLEVVDAVVAAVGPSKVGIRLSPWSAFGGLDTGVSVVPQFSCLIAELEKRGLAGQRLMYVHVIEPRAAVKAAEADDTNPGSNHFVRDIWSGTLIRAGGYKYNHAVEDTNADNNTVITVGRLFLANPDLVRRWREHLPLNQYNRDTFYTQDAKGYTDYPFYKD